MENQQKTPSTAVILWVKCCTFHILSGVIIMSNLPFVNNICGYEWNFVLWTFRILFLLKFQWSSWLLAAVEVELICAFPTHIKAAAKGNAALLDIPLGAFAEHPFLWNRRWRPKLCFLRCDLIKKWLFPSQKLALDYIKPNIYNYLNLRFKLLFRGIVYFSFGFNQDF